MWPRCEATFARAYDLGRHQKTKHTNTKRFDCPEENCRRYGIPESRGERGGFTRLDHFRDHVKNLHGKNVIKDKDREGGQHWVLDPNEGGKRLWMRDETGSIMMKDSMGRKWSKDAKTGLWRQISLEEPVLCQIGPAMSRPRTSNTKYWDWEVLWPGLALVRRLFYFVTSSGFFLGPNYRTSFFF